MLVTLGRQRVKKCSKMKFFIIKFLFVIIFLDQNMYLNVQCFGQSLSQGSVNMNDFSI